MSFADLLTPRKEVLSEQGLESIIDLANLHGGLRRKVEAKPQQCLDLIYPTADIKRIVENLSRRFSDSGDVPGLFLLEGLKGSGKSHLLVLVYHLFQSKGPAQKWLSRHGLTCSLPDDVIVVLNKFTDLRLFAIWDFVFEAVIGRSPERKAVQPSLPDVEKVLLMIA